MITISLLMLKYILCHIYFNLSWRSINDRLWLNGYFRVCKLTLEIQEQKNRLLKRTKK